MSTILGVLLYMLVVTPNGTIRLDHFEKPFNSLEACEEAAPEILHIAEQSLAANGEWVVRYRCRFTGVIK